MFIFVVSSPLENVKLLLQLRTTIHDMVEDGRLSPDILTKSPLHSFLFKTVIAHANMDIDPNNNHNDNNTSITTTIESKQTFLALFSGNFYNCLRYFPTQALNFLFKEQIKQFFKVDRNDSYVKKFTYNILSGSIVGALSLAIVYPLDTMRTRFGVGITNTTPTTRSNDSNQLQNMLETFTNLYSGFPISLFGIMAYRAAYFGLYDAARPLLAPDAGFLASFALGYSVTVSAGLISYPIDSIRRRQMLTNESAIEAIRNQTSQHGWLSLFDGGLTNVWRGMAAAFTLAAFDVVTKLYVNNKSTQSKIATRMKKVDCLLFILDCEKYRQYREQLLFDGYIRQKVFNSDEMRGLSVNVLAVGNYDIEVKNTIPQELIGLISKYFIKDEFDFIQDNINITNTKKTDVNLEKFIDSVYTSMRNKDVKYNICQSQSTFDIRFGNTLKELVKHNKAFVKLCKYLLVTRTRMQNSNVYYTLKELKLKFDCDGKDCQNIIDVKKDFKSLNQWWIDQYNFCVCKRCKDPKCELQDLYCVFCVDCIYKAIDTKQCSICQNEVGYEVLGQYLKDQLKNRAEYMLRTK